MDLSFSDEMVFQVSLSGLKCILKQRNKYMRLRSVYGLKKIKNKKKTRYEYESCGRPVRGKTDDSFPSTEPPLSFLLSRHPPPPSLSALPSAKPGLRSLGAFARGCLKVSGRRGQKRAGTGEEGMDSNPGTLCGSKQSPAPLTWPSG